MTNFQLPFEPKPMPERTVRAEFEEGQSFWDEPEEKDKS